MYDGDHPCEDVDSPDACGCVLPLADLVSLYRGRWPGVHASTWLRMDASVRPWNLRANLLSPPQGPSSSQFCERKRLALLLIIWLPCVDGRGLPFIITIGLFPWRLGLLGWRLKGFELRLACLAWPLQLQRLCRYYCATSSAWASSLSLVRVE